MQFRLVHLLALMGALPVACGMLVYATPWGAAALFSLSIASLLAALVLVAVANGPSRSFWIGFDNQPVTDAYGNVTNGSRYPMDPPFNRTGHSLFDLLLAIIGGMIGTIAHRRFRPRPNGREEH